MKKTREILESLQDTVHLPASPDKSKQEKTIETMLYTEAMINEGLRLALCERDSNRAIEVFLAHLGRYTKCDRVYIFEEKRNAYVDNTFEWCAEGVSAESDNLQNLPIGDMQMWYDSFEKQENIIITDVEHIKDINPVIYNYLKPQNINSLVVGPLIADEKIVGFYGVDNPPRELMNHISNMAWIVGHFIVAMLNKRDLVRKLEQMSYSDQLTGLGNRHALNEVVENVNRLQNMGLVYCDVMGLKRVNDNLGHIEGDRLLLRAAECLKRQFRITDLYRIGGDEFLVLCCGLTEQDFSERVKALREDMVKCGARMALGCLWTSEVQDVDALIRTADERMYCEKQEYYKQQR